MSCSGHASGRQQDHEPVDRRGPRPDPGQRREPPVDLGVVGGRERVQVQLARLDRRRQRPGVARLLAAEPDRQQLRVVEREERRRASGGPIASPSRSNAACADASDTCCSRIRWTSVAKPGSRAHSGGGPKRSRIVASPGRARRAPGRRRAATPRRGRAGSRAWRHRARHGGESTEPEEPACGCARPERVIAALASTGVSRMPSTARPDRPPVARACSRSRCCSPSPRCSALCQLTSVAHPRVGDHDHQRRRGPHAVTRHRPHRQRRRCPVLPRGRRPVRRRRPSRRASPTPSTSPGPAARATPRPTSRSPAQGGGLGVARHDHRRRQPVRRHGHAARDPAHARRSPSPPATVVVTQGGPRPRLGPCPPPTRPSSTASPAPSGAPGSRRTTRREPAAWLVTWRPALRPAAPAVRGRGRGGALLRLGRQLRRARRRRAHAALLRAAQAAERLGADEQGTGREADRRRADGARRPGRDRGREGERLVDAARRRREPGRPRRPRGGVRGATRRRPSAGPRSRSRRGGRCWSGSCRPAGPRRARRGSPRPRPSAARDERAYPPGARD